MHAQPDYHPRSVENLSTTKTAKSTPSKMTERLLEVCKEQGIQKLLFIRHANANGIVGKSRSDEPHDWKFRDQTRSLSSKGKDQCDSNRFILNGLNLKANLTSPARRASDTAALMTLDPKGGDVFLRMVESLHPAGMSTTCEDLFDKMGYGSLRKFFTVDQGQDAFEKYALTVCSELAAKSGGPAVSSLSDGDTFAIFGHAVFLNAVVYLIAKASGVSDLDIILDADLGEAEGLLLDITMKTVVHVK